MRKLLMVLMLILIPLHATNAQEKLKNITIGEEIKIHSKILGEDRTILVYLPDDYESSDKKYPVIYALDGATYFYPTLGALRFFSAYDFTPEMIVVAIPNTDRVRDLTPTAVKNMKTSGGADKFLKFMKEELFPAIEKEYRTQPFRIISGHSLGGLLTFHSLLSQPEMFNAYIAISSSLWWDDKVCVKKAEKIFKEKKELMKFLYFSIEENSHERHLQSNKQIEEILKNHTPDKFEWKYDFAEKLGHVSLWMGSLDKALRFIYSGLRFPIESNPGGLDELKEHYTKLSKKYGYRMEIPENTLNQTGNYLAMREKEYDKAVKIFEYYLELYPESPQAHDALGHIYKQKKDFILSKKHYRQAIKLAKKKIKGRN
ncbi:MAG: alpha/beta hydrolase-fold protein [Desulfobacteraceae bacterium]|jgi:predicted alpha/beta superfamily hydrolase